jgi:2-methylisocitrate lyase-like PEP mutase family enzyme
MTTIPADVIKTSNEKAAQLRELLRAPEIVIMPGAFNVLSALLYQHLGFPAIQGSSAGFANAMGYADLGISRETTVQATKLVANAVSVPVNADGEDGYGGPDEVRETVRQFVAAGAVGMNMEDGDRADKARGLVPLDFQLEKIAAFMEERKGLGSEFLLNARCDAFIGERDLAKALPEAVKRGQAYAEAGGDSIFFFGVADKDAIKTLVKEVPAPVSILSAPGIPSAKELEEMGVARVSYGSMFLRVAVGAVKRAAEEVLHQKTHTLMDDAIGGAEMKAILEGRVG